MRRNLRGEIRQLGLGRQRASLNLVTGGVYHAVPIVCYTQYDKTPSLEP